MNKIFSKNTANENASNSKGSKIRSRFLAALNSSEPFTYIVTGDSTRKNGELDSSDYYGPQLEKINFSLAMNSSGGQTVGKWSKNQGNSTLQDAIDATPGTGASTILEMSLGINPPGGVASEIREDIISGVSAYLRAKPDALIVFVSPVETGTPKNIDLDLMYQTLPSMFPGSTYVSGKLATTDVHLIDGYYLDFTHPNFNGQRRLVNYIFNSILPVDCKLHMTIEDSVKTVEPEGLVFNIKNGSWYVGGGNVLRFSENETKRATSKISVEANFIIKLDAGGNNAAYTFSDANDIVIESGIASLHDGSDGAYRSVKVPLGAVTLTYSFSTNGSEWDGLNYPIDISYIVIPTSYMSQKAVNSGINLGLPYIPNPLIDSTGNLPSAGKTMQGQADGTWLWL